MGEVVERVLFQRGERLPLLLVGVAGRSPLVAVGRSRGVAPAALQDNRAVVGRILDGLDRRHGVSSGIAREDLARHDLYTRFVGRAARDRADAAVVVLCGDHAGHVRTVARVVQVVPRDNARVGHEVESVDVSGISVAVVVLLRTVDLILVRPDVVAKLGVSLADALVEHGNDDRRIARREFPCFFALHIGSDDAPRHLAGFGAGEQVAAVDQVPLLDHQLVVERILALRGTRLPLDGLEGLARQGHGLAGGVVRAFDLTVRGGVLHLAQRRESFDHLLDGVVLVEADHVPQVQSGLAGPLLGAFVHREDPFDLVTAHQVEHLIDGEDARAGGRRPRSGLDDRLIEDVAHVALEFHEHLARYGFHLLRAFGFGRAGRRQFFVRAGTEGEQRCGADAVYGFFHILIVLC